jgi:hypothetical protein
MSSTLTCPACQGEVALPEGPLERWECPHCHNELQLTAQLAHQADEVPPHQLPVLPAVEPGRIELSDQPPGVAVADYRKRIAQQAQRPSMFGQMIGIVGGGLLGMVMGYWLLNYFGGPRYDFLKVPLPLVPHTQAAQQAPVPHALPAAPSVQEEEPPPRRQVSTPAPPPPLIPSQEPLPASSPSSPTPAFPSYSSDDLDAALAAADEPAERINAEAFAKLCRLSEVITFLGSTAGDPAFVDRRQAAQQIFQRAAADREKQASLGRMAAHLLKDRQRKQHGILLAGTVQDSGQVGDYFWTRLVLFDLPEEVVVLTSGPWSIKPQTRVLLAGSIIDDPRHRLRGYTGPAPQVVFGGLPVPLPDEGR